MPPNKDDKGCWQVVALSSEIAQDKPLSKKSLGHDYVLFRDKKNIVRVLEDRCIHRRAPLSLGRITSEGWLQCPYHGWSYEGKTGKCKLIPNMAAREKISKQHQIRAFSAVEREGLIYLWYGNTNQVDKSSLPRYGLEKSKQAVNENHGLLALPQNSFIATLLDKPSLIFNFDQVVLIEGHLMGEPQFSTNELIVEWAADWSVMAKKRKQAPADYPLLLRVTFYNGLASACVELLDEGNNVLLKAVLCSFASASCVTSLVWRWIKPPVSNLAHLVALRSAHNRLSFSVNKHVCPTGLLSVDPYVSSIWRGQLLPIQALLERVVK